MIPGISKKFSEKKYISACQAKESKALEKLYIWYAPYMKGICIRYVANLHVAEDIMQEGFIKVFDKLPVFEWKGEGSLKAWMSRVMVNLCIDYLKARKKIQHVTLETEYIEHDFVDNEGDVSLFETINNQGITKEKLLEILENLNNTNKIVFNMYAIENMKHKEIADILGISEHASRTRLKRARVELKEQLQTLYGTNRKTEVI